LSAFDDPTAPLREAPLPDAPTAAAQPGAAPPSGAMQRFQACRWRTPPENGAPDCCSHRDVLPLTGTRGFDPEAWCPDCSFYKLRRTPKKRDLTEASFWRP
jgi:hypothetical protein